MNNQGNQDPNGGHAPDTLVVMEAVSLCKVFPGTIALNDIDFQVRREAVNVVIGENGAGKSTLMRILAGIEAPTSGELLLQRSPVVLKSPRHASQHGIAMVHQELSLMPNMSIADNIFAGRELRRGRVAVDDTAQRRRAADLLKRLDLDIPVKTKVENLAIGQQQLVEIARALAQDAKILILDEPTSALSLTEIRTLFRVIRLMKQNGVAIVYISHRLQELLEIGDYFTILRDGRLVATASHNEVSETWIVERMTGRSQPEKRPNIALQSTNPEVLRVQNLSVEADGRSCVQNVSFHVKRGEILGIYGLLGAGRTELFETIIGRRRETRGSIVLQGRPLNTLATAERVGRGICLVPEDRKQDGLIPDMSILSNTSLACLTRFSRYGLVRRTMEKSETDAMLSVVHLKKCDHRLPVTTLSGGNQQKTLLARALLTRPALVILDEPTRGVDVGAKAEIYGLIRQLASEGLSVLFSSSDTTEIRELAHRVLVLSRGILAAELDVTAADDERVLVAASASTLEKVGVHA